MTMTMTTLSKDGYTFSTCDGGYAFGRDGAEPVVFSTYAALQVAVQREVMLQHYAGTDDPENPDALWNALAQFRKLTQTR